VNEAACPGLTVADVGKPFDGPRAKSEAKPDTETICGLPGALSVIVTAPTRFSVAVGLNVTEIWQLAPAANEVLQVLVSLKSPEAAMLMMLSG
jgi:hypothetical protein